MNYIKVVWKCIWYAIFPPRTYPVCMLKPICKIKGRLIGALSWIFSNVHYLKTEHKNVYVMQRHALRFLYKLSAFFFHGSTWILKWEKRDFMLEKWEMFCSTAPLLGSARCEWWESSPNWVVQFFQEKKHHHFIFMEVCILFPLLYPICFDKKSCTIQTLWTGAMLWAFCMLKFASPCHVTLSI